MFEINETLGLKSTVVGIFMIETQRRRIRLIEHTGHKSLYCCNMRYTAIPAEPRSQLYGQKSPKGAAAEPTEEIL